MSYSSPFWRPSSAFFSSPLAFDASALRYQEYPPPHLQEPPTIEDTSWTKQDAMSSKETASVKNASLSNPLLHCIQADQSDEFFSDAEEDTATMTSPSSASSTLPCSPSPSDTSFIYARRGSDKMASLIRANGDADIIGNPSAFTDMPLSWMEVKEDNMADFAARVTIATQMVKIKFMRPSRRRSISPAPPQVVDIARFATKRLPRIPVCLGEGSRGIIALKTWEVSTIHNSNDVIPTEVKTAVFPSPTNTTRPPSIKSCHSTIASSDSGSTKSLSTPFSCNTTNIMLSRQPQSPSHIPIFPPPPVPSKKFVLDVNQIYSKSSEDVLSTNWGMSLFKRRKELKDRASGSTLLERE